MDGGVNVVMYLVIGGIGLVLLAAMMLAHARQRAAIERLEDRLAHLTAGLSLLTDTAEGGFRDVAAEIGRLASGSLAARPAGRAATQRRIAGAARRGRAISDIAAAEQVSEGEIRLRLHLDQAARERAADATVR